MIIIIVGIASGVAIIQQIATNPCTSTSSSSLDSLFESANAIALISDFRLSHRRESLNLVRRVKLMLPFFEEVKESHQSSTPLPEAFDLLHNAFQSAKKLLKLCRDGSKIYLVRILSQNFPPSSVQNELLVFLTRFVRIKFSFVSIFKESISLCILMFSFFPIERIIVPFVKKSHFVL